MSLRACADVVYRDKALGNVCFELPSERSCKQRTRLPLAGLTPKLKWRCRGGSGIRTVAESIFVFRASGKTRIGESLLATAIKHRRSGPGTVGPASVPSFGRVGRLAVQVRTPIREFASNAGAFRHLSERGPPCPHEPRNPSARAIHAASDREQLQKQGIPLRARPSLQPRAGGGSMPPPTTAPVRSSLAFPRSRRIVS